MALYSRAANAEKSSLLIRGTEGLSVALVAAALVLAQILIGGTRLLFALPAFGLVAIAALLTLPSLRRIKPEPDRLCLWTSAAFFGYIIARALFSPVEYLARTDIYAVLGGLLVYLLVAFILTSARQRMSLIAVLMICAIAHVLVGAVQFRDGSQYMPISWLQRADYGRRASGFYVCPNHLAGLLEVVAIFAVSLVCWSRWPVWAKLLTAYVAAICYGGILLTGSRGGLLSSGTGLAVFLALSLLILARAGGGLFWKFAGVAVVGVVVAALVVMFVLHRSEYLAGRVQNTFELQNLRREFWRAAVQQWHLNPFWGTGSGTYLYYGRQFRSENVQVDVIRVHNDYLDLLCEYGLAGLILLAPFLAVHVRRGVRTFVRLGPKRAAAARKFLSNGLALNIAALAAVATYGAHSVVDFNLHIPANVLLLAFVFGILANPGVERGDVQPPPRSAAAFLRLPLYGLALIVLVQTVRLLPGEYFAEKARTAVRDYRPLYASYFALQGLEREQKNPNLFYYLGRARVFQGDLHDGPARTSFYLAALDAFASARTLAPRDETFALEIAFTYDRLGRFAEAEWIFGEAFALDPNSRLMRAYYNEHLERWRGSGGEPPT
jgi:O-antigen ligase